MIYINNNDNNIIYKYKYIYITIPIYNEKEKKKQILYIEIPISPPPLDPFWKSQREEEKKKHNRIQIVRITK